MEKINYKLIRSPKNKYRVGGKTKTDDTNSFFDSYVNDEDKTNVFTSRLNPIESLLKLFSSGVMEFGRSTIPDNIGGNVAQDSYLLPTRNMQQKAFYDAGYVRDYDAEKNNNYGLVQKAVNSKYGKLPIYSRTSPNTGYKRNDLSVLGNTMEHVNVPRLLVHAGSYPTAVYSDANGNLYAKSWDLNDYGGTSKGASNTYDKLQLSLADIVDKIGNPVVVTTGFQPIVNEAGKPRHISYYATDKKLENNYDKTAYNIVKNWMRTSGKTKSDNDFYQLQWNDVGFGSPNVIIRGKRLGDSNSKHNIKHKYAKSR